MIPRFPHRCGAQDTLDSVDGNVFSFRQSFHLLSSSGTPEHARKSHHVSFPAALFFVKQKAFKASLPRGWQGEVRVKDIRVTELARSLERVRVNYTGVIMEAKFESYS